MIPHAMLHPSAPISIARTSSRPASATLSDPVKVSTMIRPNSISDSRSTGSRMRARLLGGDRHHCTRGGSRYSVIAKIT